MVIIIILPFDSLWFDNKYELIGKKKKYPNGLMNHDTWISIPYFLGF